jgi:hypothetical protein
MDELHAKELCVNSIRKSEQEGNDQEARLIRARAGVSFGNMYRLKSVDRRWSDALLTDGFDRENFAEF